MNRKTISIVQLVWCEKSPLETETESGRGRERPSGAGVEAQMDTSETFIACSANRNSGMKQPN